MLATKVHIVYETISVKCPEEANPGRDRGENSGQGLRERAHRVGEELLMGSWFLLVVAKRCPKVVCSDCYTTLVMLVQL